MKLRSLGAVAMAAATAACAATTYSFTPVEADGISVGYNKGVPTSTHIGEHGSVRVSPIGLNPAGRMMFGVAALNTSDHAANLGTESVTMEAAGASVRVFTHDELERQARNAATAAMILNVVATGVSAYAAQQNATTTSYGTYHSPYGTSTWTSTHYNATAAAIGVTAATTAGAVNQRNIETALDDTLANLGENILQTTTVEPGMSYGGQVVSDRVRMPKEGPLDALVRVNYNGDMHEFRYRITAHR